VRWLLAGALLLILQVGRLMFRKQQTFWQHPGEVVEDRTWEKTLMDRWYTLSAERDQSPGANLKSRLRTFHLAHYAFDKNFESLQKSIEAMKPKAELNDDTIFEFGDKVTPGIFEVCRCLQNFVSSAMTLVDQSRVLYRKMYESDGLIPDYENEIKERFGENALHQFIQELRNITVHSRVPGVGYAEHRDFRSGSFISTYRMYFLKDELAEYGKWTAPARAFLRSSDSKIDILALAQEYHKQINDFHGCFDHKQYEAHKQELDHVNSLEDQLRQIADDSRRHHKERFPDISAKRSDPNSAESL
jgi:hypothetical protein